MKQSRSLPLLAAFASSSIFSFAFFFTVQALDVTGNDVPRMLTFRLTTAVIAMTLLWRTGILRMDFKGKDLRMPIFCGLLVPCIGFACEFYALGSGYATSGQIAMIYAIQPVLITLMGALILGERPVGRQYAFMALSVLGLVVINLGVNFEMRHPLGLILPVAALFTGSFNNVLLRRAARDFTAVETVYVTTFVGMVVFAVISVGSHLLTGRMDRFFSGLLSFRFVGSILYLGIAASVVAFMMNHYVVGTLPPVVSSSFNGFSTILTIIVGITLLGDTIRPIDIAGCGLILAGALLMNAGYRQPPTAAPTGAADTEFDTDEPDTPDRKDGEEPCQNG